MQSRTSFYIGQMRHDRHVAIWCLLYGYSVILNSNHWKPFIDRSPVYPVISSTGAPCFKYLTAYYYSSLKIHYNDVIMGAMASQITSLTIVYSTVYSDTDQRKYQSSASLAFVWGIHRGPVKSPHKWPVTRKKFPFHDVIMIITRYPPIDTDTDTQTN